MKKVLLGNEAIIKGALAAGVDFVSGYPGCPSAEIGDGFGKIAKENGIYAEWSTNEKTGLEAAIGANFSGLKTLVNMKSFGINVAADSLFPLAYTGTKTGMVIFVGDDPNCWSSAQSEQDSRGYAYLSHIPVLDPSDPQECYEFTKLAFEMSEKFNTPVILRSTTRVAHQRMPVEFEKINPEMNSGLRKIGNFSKNPHQFATMPPRTLEMKKELLEKIKKISAYAEKSKANKIVGKKDSKIGIIATGISYLHVLDALETMGLDIPVLKLGFFYPLPEKLISGFLKGKKKILVAEELEAYIGKEIVRMAKDVNPKLQIYGKDLLPEVGELDADKICLAIAKITGKKFVAQKAKVLNLPRRTARLCEGCPYWYIFPTVKRVAPDAIFAGDIGCNMIAGFAPHNIQDTLFCMGASIGIGHGIKKSVGEKQKVIAMMGDGTFFHSGIAGLINAVYN
ncbi:MAG: thiamine pyrophosphate-dependent enzyme, partial [Candidatus Staskawiczbacteria bacterium]